MCEQRKAKCEPLYSHLGFYYIFMIIDNMYITGNFYLEFQVSSKERIVGNRTVFVAGEKY